MDYSDVIRRGQILLSYLGIIDEFKHLLRKTVYDPTSQWKRDYARDFDGQSAVKAHPEL